MKTPAAEEPNPTSAPEPRFKRGDWVFCAFKLQQVEETEEDRITGVSDGFVNHGGHDLSKLCFPVEMKIKGISDNFAAAKGRLRSEGLPNLNFPDIQRWLEIKWATACQNKDDEKTVNAAIQDLDLFVREILIKCRDIRQESVDGVYLIRR
jgi:hypothetical protein